MPTDTSDWPEIYLGYHRFRSPPEFTVPEVTATIGTASVSVLHGQPGSGTEIVHAQSDVGEIIRQMSVGKWEIFVAREDAGLVVSSYTYLVFGVQRVGTDVVLTRDSMSRTQFPEGDDAEKWLFHSLTTVRPITDRGSAKGFAFDSMFFETSYLDQLRSELSARFTASASLLGAEQGSSTRSVDSNNYHLSFIIESDGHSGDTRPLAAPDDISTLPGVSVENRKFEINGADAGFSRVTMVEDGKQYTWFDAALFWLDEKQVVPDTLLTSAHLKFIYAVKPNIEAEAHAVGILTSINRGI